MNDIMYKSFMEEKIKETFLVRVLWYIFVKKEIVYL